MRTTDLSQILAKDSYALSVYETHEANIAGLKRACEGIKGMHYPRSEQVLRKLALEICQEYLTEINDLVTGYYTRDELNGLLEYCKYFNNPLRKYSVSDFGQDTLVLMFYAYKRIKHSSLRLFQCYALERYCLDSRVWTYVQTPWSYSRDYAGFFQYNQKLRKFIYLWTGADMEYGSRYGGSCDWVASVHLESEGPRDKKCYYRMAHSCDVWDYFPDIEYWDYFPQI